MTKLETSVYNLGYPLYAAAFLNERVLLVTGGGGGESNGAVPNKLTALRVDFNKKKVVKRFREITLDPRDDSPTALDASNGTILVGCNENSDKVRSGQGNHNLRKFVYENEHLKFVAALDLGNLPDPAEYLKLIQITKDGTIAATASSRVPTVIRITDPADLSEKYQIETGHNVRDMHFSPDGKILCYITQTNLVVISVVTGRFIAGKNDFDKDISLTKVRFLDDDTILLAAASAKGITVFVLSLQNETKTTVIKTKRILATSKNITAMDVDPLGKLCVLVSDDNSIALVRTKDLSVVQVVKQVHSLAITKSIFSPDSQLLASVSADNTVHVTKLPKNLGLKSSVWHKLWVFFKNFVWIVLVAILSNWVYQNNYHEDAYKYIMDNYVSQYKEKFLTKDMHHDFKWNNMFDKMKIFEKDIVSYVTGPASTLLSDITTPLDVASASKGQSFNSEEYSTLASSLSSDIASNSLPVSFTTSEEPSGKSSIVSTGIVAGPTKQSSNKVVSVSAVIKQTSNASISVFSSASISSLEHTLSSSGSPPTITVSQHSEKSSSQIASIQSLAIESKESQLSLQSLAIKTSSVASSKVNTSLKLSTVESAEDSSSFNTAAYYRSEKGSEMVNLDAESGLESESPETMPSSTISINVPNISSKKPTTSNSTQPSTSDDKNKPLSSSEILLESVESEVIEGEQDSQSEHTTSSTSTPILASTSTSTSSSLPKSSAPILSVIVYDAPEADTANIIVSSPEVAKKGLSLENDDSSVTTNVDGVVSSESQMPNINKNTQALQNIMAVTTAELSQTASVSSKSLSSQISKSISSAPVVAPVETPRIAAVSNTEGNIVDERALSTSIQ